jgi:hypothetical protein
VDAAPEMAPLLFRLCAAADKPVGCWRRTDG